MSKSWATTALLALLVASGTAQLSPPGGFTFGPPSGLSTAVAATAATTPQTTATPAAAQSGTHTDASTNDDSQRTKHGKSRASAATSSPTSDTASHKTVVGGALSTSSTGTSSEASSTAVGAPSQNEANSSSHSGSGMSSAEKIGIGVGVGVGVAVLAALAALIFLLSRRRKRSQDSNASTEKFRDVSDQPKTASVVPALAGAAALGRSASNASSQSEPRTPSQRSSVGMGNEPATPADTTAEPKSLRSLPRTPPRLVLPTQAPLADQPLEAPRYTDDYVPTPLEARSGEVSPVSPVSPAVDSRPPSPLAEDER